MKSKLGPTRDDDGGVGKGSCRTCGEGRIKEKGLNRECSVSLMIVKCDSTSHTYHKPAPELGTDPEWESEGQYHALFDGFE